MPAYSPLSLLEPSLRTLQDYMHRFYPDRAENDPIPIDFWSVDDDELFLEILSYMPLHISEEAQARFAEWPVAFQLAFPIFWLEDDYEVNGWTALTNAGENLLQRAVDAYERIGMHSEAQALTKALVSVRKAPADEEAAERAYKSVPNPYADDVRPSSRSCCASFGGIRGFGRQRRPLNEQGWISHQRGNAAA